LVVIGAGPAGLAAAHQAVQRGMRAVVLEEANQVGGLARTRVYRGFRFDIGGHRFFTKSREIQALWQQMLGDELIRVPRKSRIYYQGRFFAYPLELFDTLTKLGPVESSLILLSYVWARLRPQRAEDSFEQWVSNRFGQRLYRTFFQTYTEKVWGMPCSQIQADWAVQRIQDLSMRAVVANALFGTNNAKTLISEFYYPVLGPGMMWQYFQAAVEHHGARVCLDTRVERLEREGRRVQAVVSRSAGRERRCEGEHFVSSMPLADLILGLVPQPPEEVVDAARRLRHRDFILVGLIVKRIARFPDQWIYVHSPKVKVGRIQNMVNWSQAMSPDPQRTNLGLEYFCSVGDELWTMSDDELLALAAAELVELGLARDEAIEDGLVIRQPRAYPIYDPGYQHNVQIIRRFLASLENLQVVGRNGMHRYNNMDHSMLTGIQAVDNICGADHDLWLVSEDSAYLEGEPVGSREVEAAQ
jgi:protoporphyrinogen oxidase